MTTGDPGAPGEGAPSETPLDADLDALADSFIRRCQRGERPSIEEYAREHPALAEMIREIFPAIVFLEKPLPDPPGGGSACGESGAGAAPCQRTSAREGVACTGYRSPCRANPQAGQ